MSINAVFARISRMLSEFRSARAGNVAITFALAALVIIGCVGAAIDYSRANFVKAKMQAALDATALLLTKEASTDTSSQLQTNATKYFLAQFNPPGAQNRAVTVSYSANGAKQLTLNGSASVPTTFAAILGIKRINLDATSTTVWGGARLRVALVLDNTGSMAQKSKMSALKTATNNLLSQLKAVATVDDDVYVSIIPFVKDVNVNPVNYTASWLDWTDFDEYSGYCTVYKDWNKTKSKCLYYKGTWVAESHDKWNGCVTDRGDSTQPNPGNYDTNVVAPTTSITATLFSAEQYKSCPTAVMPLSYNWSAMTTTVNNMSPNGTTNQAIGLAHGWMSLVGGGPYPPPPAMDPGYTYSQIIILLTDGMNTQDRWYSSQSSIDARQQLTCDNIKAAGITLYTIQVNTGSDPISTLLKNCASSSDKFYYLTSASQISGVFQEIGTNLSKLRIAY
jgi:Flp pilus assembly protein TadG